jgi:hypothetical protein
MDVFSADDADLTQMKGQELVPFLQKQLIPQCLGIV